MECTFQYDMFSGMSKRTDILNTTLKLVIEKGIHNTPMSLIAEKAGAGMGTIYNYFASKEELINALYLKLKEDEADYMLQNFRSEISLDEIAKIAHMSKPAFCRFFKTKTLKTFLTYLNEMRIGYACRLLHEGGLNISQICYECGFHHPSYFNRQFKAVMKMTPMKYKTTFSVMNK